MKKLLTSLCLVIALSSLTASGVHKDIRDRAEKVHKKAGEHEFRDRLGRFAHRPDRFEHKRSHASKRVQRWQTVIETLKARGYKADDPIMTWAHHQLMRAKTGKKTHHKRFPLFDRHEAAKRAHARA